MKKIIFVFASFLGLISIQANAQTPDNTFGLNGRVIAPENGAVRAMALQSDGKLVTAGIGYTATDLHFQLLRFNSDGSLDNGFGTGGTVMTTISFLSEARAVIIQPDGKILVGGIYHTGDFANIYHLVLARYNANGTLDNTFGTNGLAMPEPAFSDELTDMVLQPDGKIVVGGAIPNNPPTGMESFMVARFNSNGTLDNSFGTAGITVTELNQGSKIVDLSLLPDGKILAGGNSGIYEEPAIDDYMDMTLARYTSQGLLDSTFGTNGIVTTNVVPGQPDFLHAALVQPDGKIVAAGSYGNSHYLVRYQSNGSIDNSFGTNGKLVRESMPGTLSMARRSNGNLVTAVHTIRNATSDFMVHGYTLNGAVDPAFGTNGSVITDLATAVPELRDDLSQCIMMQPDGKMVVGGSSNGQPALVRYTLDNGTGISNPALNTANIRVYPNPVENVLNLYNDETNGAINIILSVTDLSGRQILKTDARLNKGANTFTLPNLAAGNYILSVTTGEGKKLKQKITKK
jgi:uncharacterized delta-60 repeat protein